MKKLIFSVVILIVFSLLGWEIGTGNFSSISQKPPGNWEMVLDRKSGAVAYNWPKRILSVVEGNAIYLYIVDENIWMCTLETNDCSKTNQEMFPVGNGIALMSHIVPKTEIPPLPNESKIKDILKIGEYNGVAGIQYVYYVLLTDGTIWRWYGGGTGGEYGALLYWFGGIGWVIFLNIIAIVIIISFNKQQIEK